MFKRTIIALVGAAALVVCGNASAQLKYNYIEAGYSFTDLDGIGDGNGVNVGASFSPIQNLFLFADGTWSTVDFDEIADDIDGDSFTGTVGVGGYFPLTQNLDIVGKAGWAFSNFDLGDIADDIDSNSVEIEIGLRALLGSALEIGAFVGWDDLESSFDSDDDDDDNGLAIDLYGIYHLSHSLGIGVATTLQEDVTGFNAFVRLHF